MQETKTQQTEQDHELVSALADGELHGAEFTRALAVLASSPQAQAHWHSYHLVGDVLRAGAGTVVGAHDAAFVARLRLRLQQEEAPVLPGAGLGRVNVQPSANDSVWRWKLVAGLSSLAVVAVLGWQLTAPSQPAAQMAASEPASVPVAQAGAEAPVMIRDPRLDQLIAAHQQLGGTSALQMPAGFLRNATFERPAR
ncbi:sigma-E factor negative regulatory protein [Rhodoferax sp. BAB1]|uniref:sigma-E factor negative regulatory protein n=1 Tax=Rhodoferax sp. BAB1 TaxID=2741720 RepID=UPI001575181B|nr:sigma-E factor negative regulatory protein [Rhodoferax sp. BAB1]QKO21003.1 sigma-E factor negative regulatory protein [Rhodoferax sp. BAB1]